ncbi:hypothetical protein MPSEU_000445400 [Mayamaea pseudoterrestris]|nr:hypothetical protein MPSEU_000445400 [Mayamaea pseudoterrestris]
MSDSFVRQEDLPPATANEADDQDSVNLPPGRLHATRVPKRLSGSTSLPNLAPPAAPLDASTSPMISHMHIPSNLMLHKRQTRSMDGSCSTSRSRSPSLHKGGDRTPTTMDANSSVSSLDEMRELTIQDILTDRAGLSESIDLAKEKLLHNSMNAPMPPLAERMSDEALEDCHAFSDVRSYSSRNSSAKGVDANGDVSIALEPLNECDDEDDLDLENIDEESDDEYGPDHDKQSHPQVILTNLDNLNLNQDVPDGESEPFHFGGGSQTG